jgi:hypothetical protein
VLHYKRTRIQILTAKLESLFDSTKVSFQSIEGTVHVECAGLYYSIVEVVEVLAWVGVALREASDPSGVRYSIAHIDVDRNTSSQNSGVRFQLSFDEAPLEPEDSIGNGFCWQSLLRNPVIAKGFPVPARTNAMPSGLEIPVEAMGLLVGAPRLTIFDNRAVLKGFNAAIVATKHHQSFTCWHFIFNDVGERLSYSDSRIMKCVPLNLSNAAPEILASRHILGWIPTVSYNIGMLFVAYLGISQKNQN